MEQEFDNVYSVKNDNDITHNLKVKVNVYFSRKIHFIVLNFEKNNLSVSVEKQKNKI